jgi:hypothetical protein
LAILILRLSAHTSPIGLSHKRALTLAIAHFLQLIATLALMMWLCSPSLLFIILVCSFLIEIVQTLVSLIVFAMNSYDTRQLFAGEQNTSTSFSVNLDDYVYYVERSEGLISIFISLVSICIGCSFFLNGVLSAITIGWLSYVSWTKLHQNWLKFEKRRFWLSYSIYTLFFIFIYST